MPSWASWTVGIGLGLVAGPNAVASKRPKGTGIFRDDATEVLQRWRASEVIHIEDLGAMWTFFDLWRSRMSWSQGSQAPI